MGDAMNYEPAVGRQSSAEPMIDAEPERGPRLWLVGAAGVALVAVLGGGWYAMNAKKAPAPQTTDASTTTPSVTVMTATRTAIDREVTATGTLAAKRDMPISVVGEGGMVTRVLVEPGDWVKAGQVLVTIERSVQNAQIQSSASNIAVAEANARIAQSELDRAQALVSRGFISKADVERKAATRDAALAQVRVARAQLNETAARARRLDIRAPASGLILTRTVEPGQVIAGGAGVLFRLARAGEMEMRAQLAEADLAQLRVGAGAEVTPNGAPQHFSGHVWQLAPVVDPQSRQGTARIALPYSPAIRPGGFATAKLKLGTIDAPLLPESAVLSSEKGSFVYIINAQNRAERRPVTVADVSDDGIAIGAGLDGSEHVVVSAGAFLNPGEKVVPVLQKHG